MFIYYMLPTMPNLIQLLKYFALENKNINCDFPEQIKNKKTETIEECIDQIIKGTFKDLGSAEEDEFDEEYTHLELK